MPIYTPIETTILEAREDEKIENYLGTGKTRTCQKSKQKQSEKWLLDQIPMLLISKERENEKNTNC